MSAVAEALRRFNHQPAVESGLFRLVSTLGGPASPAEIEAAWPNTTVPVDLVDLWSVARSARLFEDVVYGQWGLVLLSPQRSAARTELELTERRRDFRAGDVVIGEFLGELDLAVRDAGGRVLIALPLDDRSAWPVAAGSVAEFIRIYHEYAGAKYWEAAEQES